MCILVIRKDQNHSFFNFKGFNCRKIIHLILILFFLWKLIDNLKLALLSKQILHMENEKNVYNNGNVGYIYLATIMTLGLILGFLKFGNRVNNKLPPVMQLCQCLLNLEANS
jgi:hypothetical protein